MKPVLAFVFWCITAVVGVASANQKPGAVPSINIATGMSYTVSECRRGVSKIVKTNSYTAQQVCGVSGGKEVVERRYECQDPRARLLIETYPEVSDEGEDVGTTTEVWCYKS